MQALSVPSKFFNLGSQDLSQQTFSMHSVARRFSFSDYELAQNKKILDSSCFFQEKILKYQYQLRSFEIERLSSLLQSPFLIVAKEDGFPSFHLSVQEFISLVQKYLKSENISSGPVALLGSAIHHVLENMPYNDLDLEQAIWIEENQTTAGKLHPAFLKIKEQVFARALSDVLHKVGHKQFSFKEICRGYLRKFYAPNHHMLLISIGDGYGRNVEFKFSNRNATKKRSTLAGVEYLYSIDSFRLPLQPYFSDEKTARIFSIYGPFALVRQHLKDRMLICKDLSQSQRGLFRLVQHCINGFVPGNDYGRNFFLDQFIKFYTVDGQGKLTSQLSSYINDRHCRSKIGPQIYQMQILLFLCAQKNIEIHGKDLLAQILKAIPQTNDSSSWENLFLRFLSNNTDYLVPLLEWFSCFTWANYHRLTKGVNSISLGLGKKAVAPFILHEASRFLQLSIGNENGRQFYLSFLYQKLPAWQKVVAQCHILEEKLTENPANADLFLRLLHALPFSTKVSFENIEDGITFSSNVIAEATLCYIRAPSHESVAIKICQLLFKQKSLLASQFFIEKFILQQDGIEPTDLRFRLEPATFFTLFDQYLSTNSFEVDREVLKSIYTTMTQLQTQGHFLPITQQIKVLQPLRIVLKNKSADLSSQIQLSLQAAKLSLDYPLPKEIKPAEKKSVVEVYQSIFHFLQQTISQQACQEMLLLLLQQLLKDPYFALFSKEHRANIYYIVLLKSWKHKKTISNEFMQELLQMFWRNIENFAPSATEPLLSLFLLLLQYRTYLSNSYLNLLCNHPVFSCLLQQTFSKTIEWDVLKTLLEVGVSLLQSRQSSQQENIFWKQVACDKIKLLDQMVQQQNIFTAHLSDYTESYIYALELLFCSSSFDDLKQGYGCLLRMPPQAAKMAKENGKLFKLYKVAVEKILSSPDVDARKLLPPLLLQYAQQLQYSERFSFFYINVLERMISDQSTTSLIVTRVSFGAKELFLNLLPKEKVQKFCLNALRRFLKDRPSGFLEEFIKYIPQIDAAMLSIDNFSCLFSDIFEALVDLSQTEHIPELFSQLTLQLIRKSSLVHFDAICKFYIEPLIKSLFFSPRIELVRYGVTQLCLLEELLRNEKTKAKWCFYFTGAIFKVTNRSNIDALPEALKLLRHSHEKKILEGQFDIEYQLRINLIEKVLKNGSVALITEVLDDLLNDRHFFLHENAFKVFNAISCFIEIFSKQERVDVDLFLQLGIFFNQVLASDRFFEPAKELSNCMGKFLGYLFSSTHLKDEDEVLKRIAIDLFQKALLPPCLEPVDMFFVREKLFHFLTNYNDPYTALLAQKFMYKFWPCKTLVLSPEQLVSVSEKILDVLSDYVAAITIDPYWRKEFHGLATFLFVNAQKQMVFQSFPKIGLKLGKRLQQLLFYGPSAISPEIVFNRCFDYLHNKYLQDTLRKTTSL